MTRTVDARGLSCPQPVVLTMKAIAEASEVTAIVDNPTAVENVTRLARSKGCTVEVLGQDDGVRIVIKREGAPAGMDDIEHAPTCSSAPAAAGPPVLFVPSDSFGRGPEELGQRLMGAFFHSLLEVEPRPGRAIFMNSGVKLVIEGSRALEDIRALAARGVEILVCGTCLGYFDATDKLAVGQVSNMYDIATALMEADRIVEL